MVEMKGHSDLCRIMKAGTSQSQSILSWSLSDLKIIQIHSPLFPDTVVSDLTTTSYSPLKESYKEICYWSHPLELKHGGKES